MPKIGIVDYGRGNLRSVAKALEAVGASVKLGSSPKALEACQGLLLPGVGAFGDAMSALRRQNLIGFLKRAAKAGRPLMGVCLGQQLFYERGTEFGRHEGLGFFKGGVKRFAPGLKVPHMGWNQVHFKAGFPLAKGLAQDSEFYFVHSFRGQSPDVEAVAGVTEYGDERFDSALWRDNLFATQFHPEKSQKAGLKLYANFWALVRRN
jgi:glutamine amidotransferase